jgi:hybrid cluster-associated redox disulfide protein
MAQDWIPDAELLQLPVAGLLTRWPSAAQVFLGFRMACIGCDFSGFDTVVEALEVHGVPAQAFLDHLMAAMLSAPTSTSDPIQGVER